MTPPPNFNRPWKWSTAGRDPPGRSATSRGALGREAESNGAGATAALHSVELSAVTTRTPPRCRGRRCATRAHRAHQSGGLMRRAASTSTSSSPSRLGLRKPTTSTGRHAARPEVHRVPVPPTDVISVVASPIPPVGCGSSRETAVALVVAGFLGALAPQPGGGPVFRRKLERGGVVDGRQRCLPRDHTTWLRRPPLLRRR